MKINVKTIVVYYLLILAFSIGIVEHDVYWKFGLIFILSLLVIRKVKIPLLNRKYCFLLFALIAMFIISTFAGGSFQFFLKNLYTIFPCFLLFLLFSYIESGQDFSLITFLRNHKLLLNAIFIFSLFILSLQVKGSNILLKDTWVLSITYREDLCNGIFGPGGSHQFTVFAIFILTLNYYCIEKKVFKRNKIAIYFTVASQIWMAILSVSNDNTSYFIMLPIMVLVIMLNSHNALLSVKNIKKFILFILLAMVIVSVPEINEFLQKTLIVRLRTFSTNQAGGSNERVFIPLYAFRNVFGLTIGMGFSTLPFDGTVTLLEIPHFGINSFGTIVFLCGIWNYLLYTYIYFISLGGALKRWKKIDLLIMFVIIMFSFYTNPYWDMVITILLYLLFCVLKGVNGNEQISSNVNSNTNNEQKAFLD